MGARRALQGQTVQAEVLEVDHHGRTVARCMLADGRDLSAEMVKLGLALDWPRYSGGAYGALERADIRKRLWLADARQRGRTDLWYAYESRYGDRDRAGPDLIDDDP